MPAATVVRVHPSSDKVTVNSTLSNIHLQDGNDLERQWFARCAVDDVAPGVPPNIASQSAFWQAVREPLMQGMHNNTAHFAVILAGAKHSGKSHTLFGDWVGDAKLSSVPPEDDGIVMRFYEELFSSEGNVEAVDMGMLAVIHEVAYDLFDGSQSYHFQKDLATHDISGSQYHHQRWITCHTVDHAADALRMGLIHYGHVLSEHMPVNNTVQLFVLNRIWTATHVVHYTFAELDLRHADDDIFREDHLLRNAKTDLSGRALCDTAKAIASNDKDWQLVCSGGVASYLLLPALAACSYMVVTCVNGRTEHFKDNCTALDFMTELGTDRAVRATQPKIERTTLVKCIKQEIESRPALFATRKSVLNLLMHRSLQSRKHLRQLSVKSLSMLKSNITNRGFLMTEQYDDMAAPSIRLILDDVLACSMLVELQQLVTILGKDVKPKDDEQQVCLHGIGIFDRHVRFTRMSDKLEFMPFEDAICFVNGQQISSAVLLNDKDVILLGMNTVLQVHMPMQRLGKHGEDPAIGRTFTTWSKSVEVLAGSTVATIHNAWMEYRKSLHHLKADRQMATLQHHDKRQTGDVPSEPMAATAEFLNIKQQFWLNDARLPPTSLAELVLGVRIANYISAQMASSVEFKVATMSKAPNNDVEHDSDRSNELDHQHQDNVAFYDEGERLSFYVRVAVLDPHSGHISNASMWSLSKWCNRLSMITRMYGDYLRLDDRYRLAELYPEGLSPFHDPLDHELVGVAFLHLNPFTYLLDVRDSLPVMNFNGMSAGYLTLNGRAWIDEIEPNPTYLAIDKEANLMDFLGRNLVLKLYLESLQGLPDQYCQDVYVSFRFLFHRHAYSTPRIAECSCNPKIDAVICITERITTDVMEYVEKGAIELEVWARRSGAALPQEPQLVGDAQHIFNKTMQPENHLRDNQIPVQNADPNQATRRSIRAPAQESRDSVNKNRRGSLNSAQQKATQLRNNIYEHERTAALLAVRQAETRLNKLTTENNVLQSEVEALRAQCLTLTTDTAEKDPSEGRVKSKICSIS